MDKRKGKRTIMKLEQQPNYSMDYQFSRFYQSKQAAGMTRNTLQSYKDNYKFIREYLGETDPDIRNITTDTIREYIIWMLHRKTRFEGHQYKSESEMTIGLSPTTVNIRIKFLRTFFNFLIRENVIDFNPMSSIKNLYEDSDKLKVISPIQLQQLLETPDKKTYCGFRDYTLMNLLLDSFLRINEALNIKIDDIDTASGMIAIRGETSKSRKTRLVPASKRTIQLINDLIRINNVFDTDYIFLSNYGERLAAGQFRHRLKEYAAAANISLVIHPHLFRHTGATMYLEAGGDLRHLQMILGHRDLRMVLRYTHLSNKSLKSQHDQFSPIGQIVGKLNKNRLQKI